MFCNIKKVVSDLETKYEFPTYNLTSKRKAKIFDIIARISVILLPNFLSKFL